MYDFGRPTPAPAPPTDPALYLIRANQGHSLPIASAALLSPVTALTLPALIPEGSAIVHGSYLPVWPLILASGGLSRMTRSHIHFAIVTDPSYLSPSLSSSSLSSDATLPAPTPASEPESVIAAPTTTPVPLATAEASPSRPAEPDLPSSGMRPDCTLLLAADLRRSLAGGVQWWRSANGVVLTEGSDARTGVLSLEWIERVVVRSSGKVLWQDGREAEHLTHEELTMGRRGGRGKGRGAGGRGGGGRGARKGGRGRGRASARAEDGGEGEEM